MKCGHNLNLNDPESLPSTSILTMTTNAQMTTTQPKNERDDGGRNTERPLCIGDSVGGAERKQPREGMG